MEINTKKIDNLLKDFNNQSTPLEERYKILESLIVAKGYKKPFIETVTHTGYNEKKYVEFRLNDGPIGPPRYLGATFGQEKETYEEVVKQFYEALSTDLNKEKAIIPFMIGIYDFMKEVTSPNTSTIIQETTD